MAVIVTEAVPVLAGSTAPLGLDARLSADAVWKWSGQFVHGRHFCAALQFMDPALETPSLTLQPLDVGHELLEQRRAMSQGRRGVHIYAAVVRYSYYALDSFARFHFFTSGYALANAFAAA